MNNKGSKGIHIGSYRVTPLGIAVFAFLILAVIAVVLYFTLGSSGNNDSVSNLSSNTAAPGTVGSQPLTGDKAADDLFGASDVGSDTTDAPSLIATNSPTPVPATNEPTIEPTQAPTPEPVQASDSAVIRFVGEISIDDAILEAAADEEYGYSFADIISPVAGAVGNADYTIADVEGSLGGIGDGYSGAKSFNTPEMIISDLADAGVDMLALANDHALDNLYQGLLDTIANCEAYGMDYVGAATSQEEHDLPKIITVNGINIGLLNYTTTLNGAEKNTNAEATIYGVNLANKSTNVAKDVNTAREAGADVVICIMSWSKDYSAKVNDNQKKVIKALANAGVDAIIGYGPRIPQTVGWFEVKDKKAGTSRRVLCAASVGTFLTGSEKKGANCGTIFELTVKKQADGSYAIESPRSIPTYVWKNTVDNKNEYRVLAIGEWAQEKPEGMSDDAYKQMTSIWKALPDVLSKQTVISAN